MSLTPSNHRCLPSRPRVAGMLHLAGLFCLAVALPGNAQELPEPEYVERVAEEGLAVAREKLTPDQVDKAKAAKKKIDQYVDVDADDLEVDRKQQVIRAKGNVRIVQTGVMELRADRAEYRYRPKRIKADGNIRFTRRGDLFTSERVELDLSEQSGFLNAVKADLNGPGKRGTAESIVIHDRDRLTMNNASFTNCECDDPAWKLTSEKIEIDRLENSVTANNVRLHLGAVPIGPLPWWRHPLEARKKSGFLTPSFQATGNGFEMEVPYFWNIAPNRDATLALRGITERGVMGKLQYRYLGHNHSGQLDTYHIHDTLEEKHRGLTLFDHRQQMANGWRLAVHGEASQTRDFISDFEQDLVDPRRRRLESSVVLNRLWLRDRGWSGMSGGARWYQDLEAVNDDFTVQSLPFALISDSRSLGPTPADGEINVSNWQLNTDLRLDNFYQMAGDAAQRVDIAPVLHYERPLYIGRMEAVFGLRETAYLTQGDPSQTQMVRDDSDHREASLFGLRLDGHLARTYGNGAKHTIEPSVQYVHNAVTDQSQLPDYDATLRNFTTTNLFTHNLYSGVDRISSGHWVTYGLTSRLLQHNDDNAIIENAVLTLGQRWAPSGHREYQRGEAFSDMAGRLAVAFSEKVETSATARYNPYSDQFDATDAFLTLTLAERNWLALGYHFNRTEGDAELVEDGSERIEAITANSSYQLSEHWFWTQEADYSLVLDDIKSWETGLAYEHQCWTLRLSGGRRLATDTNRHGGGFFGLYFNLLGLGGYGV